MTTRQGISTAVALAMIAGSTPAPLMAGAQQRAALSGTAKNEAKKPFPEFTVQVRDVGPGATGGPIAGSVALDPNGSFALAGLTPSKFIVELLNKKGKVVCTEGPFDLTQAPMAKNDVVVDCNHTPVAWWLLAAAGAAAITAGVASNGPESPSQ
jgi:hypothetical protein